MVIPSPAAFLHSRDIHWIYPEVLLLSLRILSCETISRCFLLEDFSIEFLVI